MGAMRIPDPAELEDQPEEEQPRSSSRLVQWLVVMALAVLFVPLYLIGTTIKADIIPLSTDAAAIDATLNATTGPNATEKSLKATLSQIQKQVNALAAARPTVGADWLDWPTLMAVIGRYDQTQVVITGIVQTGKVITVNGQATDEDAVTAYAQLLKDSNQFGRVIVQGITIRPSPTAPPTATLPPSPTATPTSVPSTKTNAPAPTAVPPTPTVPPTVVVDVLRDKYATFTILLQTKSSVSGTPAHP